MLRSTLLNGLAISNSASDLAPIQALPMIADAGHFAAFLQPERFLDQLLTLVRPLVSFKNREGATVRSSAMRSGGSALQN